MFMGTILDNILMGNIQLLHELINLINDQTVLSNYDNKPIDIEIIIDYLIWKLLQITKKARVDDILHWQEDGILSKIGDRGSGLSGGELQRIALARLFFKDPEICLLDEATSALDYSLAQNIITEFEEFFKNKTCFVITHKPEDWQHLFDEQVSLVDQKF